jgi:hypothetical protein
MNANLDKKYPSPNDAVIILHALPFPSFPITPSSANLHSASADPSYDTRAYGQEAGPASQSHSRLSVYSSSRRSQSC